jgi:hypothetical protein
MRGWHCHLHLLLALDSAFILGSKSRRTRDHILLSQIRDFPLLPMFTRKWIKHIISDGNDTTIVINVSANSLVCVTLHNEIYTLDYTQQLLRTSYTGEPMSVCATSNCIF